MTRISFLAAARASLPALAVILRGALLATTAMLAAPPVQAGTTGIQAIVGVKFTGSSSLHDWEGKAPPVTTVLRASATPGAWDVDFRVPVSGLDSGNSRRDANMRAMLRADRFPDIGVTVGAVDPEAVQRDLRIAATLTIAGTTKEVTAHVSNWKRDGDNASFDIDTDVSLASFGLEAPSVLGLVRVADVVKMKGHVEVVATAEPVAAGSEAK